jgi:SAM-dependent methyltransferase
MPDWDDIYKKRGKVFIKPHPDMERLANLFKEKEVKRILDLGCGNGRHLMFFGKRGFDIYGMDASSKGIELAKQWLVEEGVNVDLKCHRMEDQFPYKKNFFDAIISIQVIHHNFKKDILLTVHEIERVLKKGGFIFITVTYSIEKGFDKGDLKKVEEGTFIPQKGQEKGVPHHFFSLKELKDTFHSFELIEIYKDKTNHRAILGIKR